MLRPPFTRQPQHRRLIDRGNPLTRGLVGAWVPTFGRYNNAGISSAFTITGQRATPSGVGGLYVGTLATPTTDAKLFTAGYSFLIGFTTGTVTSGVNGCVLGRGPTDTGNNNKGFGFHLSHVSGSYQGAVYQGSGYSVIGKIFVGAGAAASNTHYVLGCGSAGGTGSIYNNGNVMATTSSLSAVNTTGALALGRTSAAGDAVSAATVYEFYYEWDRKLTDQEFRSLSRNPWQIFTPLQRRLWAPAAPAFKPAWAQGRNTILGAGAVL